jgi:hypothetical protein
MSLLPRFLVAWVIAYALMILLPPGPLSAGFAGAVGALAWLGYRP